MTVQRVFVTGATGYLGTAIVCDLLSRGVAVRALVRRSDAAMRLVDAATLAAGTQSRRLELAFGSLRDEPLDHTWLSGCDAIVHAAGVLRGAASVLVRANVVGTRGLADAAAVCGIRRFVLISSLSVYASQSLAADSVLDETCPIEPEPERRGAYVYSKVAQEAVCRGYAFPLVVIRPGVLFGPGRHTLSDRVGPRVGPLVIVVDGHRPLPYSFVTNCASAVVAAVHADGIDGGAFNIVDDELPTAAQIVTMCRQWDRDLRAVHVPFWSAALVSSSYRWCYARSRGFTAGRFPPMVDALYKPLRFSNAAAKKKLLWQPRVGLEAALQLMMRRHAAETVMCRAVTA
jgi:nucleoside-diphosphate-sugar epimerase